MVSPFKQVHKHAPMKKLHTITITHCMQAKALVWHDLSAEQLENIRRPHPKKGLTSRDLLAKFIGIKDQNNPRTAISLDLYVHTLQFGQVPRNLAIHTFVIQRACLPP